MMQYKFINYEMKKIPDSILKFSDIDTLNNIIKSKIERKMKLTTDKDIAEKFMKNADHNTKNINDYFIHTVTAGKGKFILSHIDFNSVHSNAETFVRIAAKNFDIISYKKNTELLNILKEKYCNFRLKYILFFETAKTDVPDLFEKNDLYVAGHINTIKRNPKPDRYDEVRLEKMNDLSFFEQYLKEYKRVIKENENAKMENIIPKEGFEWYLSTGIVYKIIIYDEYAGIFAVKKMNMEFLTGYFVIEKILFKKFRGKNFGAAVERNFTDNLDAIDNEFIYGTIHSINKPSLKSALKCGRFIAGCDYKLYF